MNKNHIFRGSIDATVQNGAIILTNTSILHVPQGLYSALPQVQENHRYPSVFNGYYRFLMAPHRKLKPESAVELLLYSTGGILIPQLSLFDYLDLKDDLVFLVGQLDHFELWKKGDFTERNTSIDGLREAREIDEYARKHPALIHD